MLLGGILLFIWCTVHPKTKAKKTNCANFQVLMGSARLAHP